MAEVQGYWWCPECEEECIWSRVTSEEKHDTCGHSVTWIEPDGTNWQARAAAAEVDAERLAEGAAYVLPGWCQWGIRHGVSDCPDCPNDACPWKLALAEHDKAVKQRGVRGD